LRISGKQKPSLRKGEEARSEQTFSKRENPDLDTNTSSKNPKTTGQGYLIYPSSKRRSMNKFRGGTKEDT
jgi:hypothetical protein